MQVGEYRFMADNVSKFFNTVRVAGWFYHPTDKLESIDLSDRRTINTVTKVGLPYGGVSALGQNLGFELHALRDDDADIDAEASLNFVTEGGKRLTVSLAELCAERRSLYASNVLSSRFNEAIAKVENARILDIGGRDRSKYDRSTEFKDAECIVLDIHPGQNVDVVGDAHKLADYFPSDHFDAFYSIAVFEHLLMPWAVVPQINRVLKSGGIGYIRTHQTIGMHDVPWDFWRFSDTAWDALFNRLTGFEIIARAMDGEQFIIPFIYTPKKHDAEKAAGFEGSSVLIRKTGPCQLSWPVTPSDVITTSYPMDHDGGLPPEETRMTGSLASAVRKKAGLRSRVARYVAAQLGADASENSLPIRAAKAINRIWRRLEEK